MLKGVNLMFNGRNLLNMYFIYLLFINYKFLILFVRYKLKAAQISRKAILLTHIFPDKIKLNRFAFQSLSS